MASRQYLYCSFQEKDEVKKLGAHWDAAAKKWYVPDWADATRFNKFLQPRILAATANPGQPRGGLFIDLVPSTCWYSNVRSMVPATTWDTIRRKVYRDANYLCHICGGHGKKHPVEAHERWSFNLATRIQTLQGIEALCPACHEATHYGFAQTQSRDGLARQRYAYVNGWDTQQIEHHIQEAFSLWKKRNTVKQWTLDLMWLTQYVALDPDTCAMLEDVKNGKAPRH